MPHLVRLQEEQERKLCYPTRMRLMGIDYGSKRVGVALSDDKGLMAFPKAVFRNDSELLKNVVALIEKENVGKVIVGHSKDREGGDNPIHEKATDFITDLTLEMPIPIELEPEQYTTKEATRFQGKNDMTDASAAAIILNSYITRQHG